MRVGKPEPYAAGKDIDAGTFTFNGYAGTLDPTYPILLKAARQSPTVVTATPHHEQQFATLLYLRCSRRRERGRSKGNNGFEDYRQCLVYGTSDQEGSTGLFVKDTASDAQRNLRASRVRKVWNQGSRLLAQAAEASRESEIQK